ncbi:hypothetical protein DPQ22_06245 [Candidatus Tokpelaia sp.]|nr:hypothetical protein DPQ22_06245 [Candidatus Tokpelaia sp.]
MLESVAVLLLSPAFVIKLSPAYGFCRQISYISGGREIIGACPVYLSSLLLEKRAHCSIIWL